MNLNENETVVFELNSNDVKRPQWSVTMNDDGSLTVFACGRRNGNVAVLPQSQNAVVVSTDKILSKPL